MEVFMLYDINKLREVKISQTVINHLLILSKSLDRNKIISRSMLSLLLILKYYEDNYSLHYVPKKNGKNFLALVLPVCIDIASRQAVNFNDDTRMCNVVLSSNVIYIKEIEKAKEYLRTAFHLRIVPDQLFMNLALIVYKNNLEALVNGNYEIHMFHANEFCEPSVLLCFD